jgi:hypothetical protein
MSRPTTRIGAYGDDVAYLHQLLAESGFPCAGDVVPPFFGRETLEVVRFFQACNVGPDGENLAPDGVVGPRTWWSLEICGSERVHSPHPDGPVGSLPDMPTQEASNPVAAAALASAWGELRLQVREVPNGSNRGPRVDLYTGFSGKPPEVKGPPWCAYFASWNFARAPGGSPFGRLGGALAIVDYCREHFPGSVVDVSDPGACLPGRRLVQAGDLGVVDAGGGHGHVFQVAAVRNGTRDGTVWTVEGNSGNAVRARKRVVSTVRWFVNFDRYARQRGS